MTTSIATPLASEQGHWYTADGEPCYTVTGKNGNERPTTLRDARTMALVPSVTGIIRCAASEGLERWKRRQLALACLTLPRIEGESEDSFLARAEKDAMEEGKAAAERGTTIHAAIESHFKAEPFDPKYDPWVIAAVTELSKGCIGAWHTEKSFAHPLGYGGKIDLHNDRWLIDIKTKDGEPDGKLYDEHLMQLAAYDYGLTLNTPEIRRCGILFVQREKPEAMLIEAAQDDLQRGHRMFLALLDYWYARTGLER